MCRTFPATKSRGNRPGQRPDPDPTLGRHQSRAMRPPGDEAGGTGATPESHRGRATAGASAAGEYRRSEDGAARRRDLRPDRFTPELPGVPGPRAPLHGAPPQATQARPTTDSRTSSGEALVAEQMTRSTEDRRRDARAAKRTRGPSTTRPTLRRHHMEHARRSRHRPRSR